jgi:signal transduction histidine kinase
MPRTIALAYLVFGALWIFLSDRLLTWLDVPPERITQAQTLKGWLFILASAVLLYWLLVRYEKKTQAAMQAQVDSQAEIQRMNADLEQRVSERTLQLEAANRELESFAYAVSHDLRAPLRSLSGFSQILAENSPPGLDDQSRHYLHRIRDASQRMSRLIEDLLGLSRIGRSELVRRPVDLSQIAAEAVAALRERTPDRSVDIKIAPDLHAEGDARLLRIAFDNLLDNAWKYTSRRADACVEVGVQTAGSEQNGRVFFVRDNGVGFDMAYANKLFTPFQRLHTDAEFPGAGIGLVTVQRILARHGGRIWADAQPGQGAAFYFTLGS